MSSIFSALSALLLSAAKQDWAGAVNNLLVLVQAIMTAFPAHVRYSAKAALVQHLQLVGEAAPHNESDAGSFFE
jgi:hypothetical protein